MTDAQINPLGPPVNITPITIAAVTAVPQPSFTSNAWLPDYTSNAALAVDQAFLGRVQQCMKNQSRLFLEAARAAGINPSDLAMAHEIASMNNPAISPNRRVSATVALLASDPSLAHTYAQSGNSQSGITDAQILTLVLYFWHPISTS